MGVITPPVPSRASRVASALLGGGVALGITVGLAVAQSGSSDPAHPAAGPRHAIAAERATAPAPAASSSTSTSLPAPSTAAPSTTTAVPSSDTAAESALAAGGIPATALAAYRNAAAVEAVTDRACRLPWALLAGIGRVESDHGRFAGAVLHADGVSTPRIIGIPLDGHGTEVVRDTDRGRLDGDTTYDRAVGPMQFIPSTWATWGRDGNHDGVRDPFNVFDAARAAADYLCAAGGDLGTAAGQQVAVLTYNHSDAYLNEVLGLERSYAAQFGVAIPVLPHDVHGGTGSPALPPADPAGGRRAATPASTTTAGTPGSTARTSAPHPSTSAPTRPGGSATAPACASPSPTGTSTGPSTPGTPTPTPTPTPTSSPSPGSSTSPTASATPTCAPGTHSTTTPHAHG